MKQSRRHIALIWLALTGDAEAHDWYTDKTDPVLHYKCCGQNDCHPVDPNEVRSTREGYYVKLYRPSYLNDPPGEEWFIPWERVQSAPDDRYHICESLFPVYRTIAPNTNFETRYRFRWTCFFAPMNTSSIAQSGHAAQ